MRAPVKPANDVGLFCVADVRRTGELEPCFTAAGPRVFVLHPRALWAATTVLRVCVVRACLPAMWARSPQVLLFCSKPLQGFPASAAAFVSVAHASASAALGVGAFRAEFDALAASTGMAPVPVDDGGTWVPCRPGRWSLWGLPTAIASCGSPPCCVAVLSSG